MVTATETPMAPPTWVKTLIAADVMPASWPVAWEVPTVGLTIRQSTMASPISSEKGSTTAAKPECSEKVRKKTTVMAQTTVPARYTARGPAFWMAPWTSGASSRKRTAPGAQASPALRGLYPRTSLHVEGDE